MNEKKPVRWTRRETLGAGAAALAGLLVDASWIEEARAQSAVLTADPRYAFADRLSDLVIPVTDTPGASAAGVAAFVLLALDRGMSDLDPTMLDKVRMILDSGAAGDFMDAPAAKQIELLTSLDQRTYAGARPPLDSPEYAWRRIKAAIVSGYYTSEIGASKELVYEPVPGGFRNFKLTADFRVRSNDGFGGAL